MRSTGGIRNFPFRLTQIWGWNINSTGSSLPACPTKFSLTSPTILLSQFFKIYPYLSMCVLCVHAQSCPNPCNPMDWSPPGSSVHWVSWARILEWVAISSSRGSSWPRHLLWLLHRRWILYHWATGEDIYRYWYTYNDIHVWLCFLRTTKLIQKLLKYKLQISFKPDFSHIFRFPLLYTSCFMCYSQVVFLLSIS